MRTCLALIPLAALTGAAFAQSTYRIVPRGHDTVEGGATSHVFATYPSMRIQWAEGELGNSPVRLKGIGFRRGGSIWIGGGRKYANLTIQCSDCDHRTLSRFFTANSLSTPTRVFSNSIALPMLPPYAVQPRPWLSSLNFPFRTAYLHSGRKDLLLHATMWGGSLDFGAWTRNVPYSLDAPTVGYPKYSWPGYLGDGPFHQTNKVGCRDSRTNTFHGPYANTSIARTLSGAPTNPNRVSATSYAAWVPPKTPIAFLHGVPLLGGVTIPGVTCNKLYVDPTRSPSIRFVTSRDVLGYTDVGLNLTGGWIPAQPGWAGIAVATQIAFADSGNGSMRLSQASVSNIPTPPLPSIKRSMTFSPSLQTTAGYNPSKLPSYFPVIRYTL